MPKRSLSDLVLDTIDIISARKNRPNLLRIYRYLHRLYDLSLTTCESLLQSLLKEGRVICVTYKGSISYRNAEKWKKLSYYMKKSKTMHSELSGNLLTNAISELIVQEPDYLHMGVPCTVLEEHLLGMTDQSMTKEGIHKLLLRELKRQSLLQLENGNYFVGPKPVEAPSFNKEMDINLESPNKTKNDQQGNVNKKNKSKSYLKTDGTNQSSEDEDLIQNNTLDDTRLSNSKYSDEDSNVSSELKCREVVCSSPKVIKQTGTAQVDHLISYFKSEVGNSSSNSLASDKLNSEERNSKGDSKLNDSKKEDMMKGDTTEESTNKISTNDANCGLEINNVDKNRETMLVHGRLPRTKRKKYDASEYYFPSLKKRKTKGFISENEKKEKDEKPKKKIKKTAKGQNLSGKFAKRVMFPGNTNMCSECHCYVSKVKLDSMVSCTTCSNEGHRACAMKTMQGRKWYCVGCRKENKDLCANCDMLAYEEDKGKLYLCIKCKDQYHKTCATPQIQLPLRDSWTCSTCSDTLCDKIASFLHENEIKGSSKSDNGQNEAIVKVNGCDEDSACSEQRRSANNFWDSDPPDPTSWTSQQVYNYFKKYFEEEVAQAILEQDIDGYAVKLLDRSDILQLGFKLGISLKILLHVKRLQLHTNNLHDIWSQ